MTNLNLTELVATKQPPETDADRFARYAEATAHLDAPFAVLDRHALAANAHDLLRRANGMPIRVASKSVRSVEVLQAVLALPGFAGVLGFTVPEAIHLVRSGVSDDVVVGYPSTQRAAITEVARDPQLRSSITFMIDHPDQARILERAVRDAGENPAVTRLRVCLDLDMSYRVAGVHIGARRSPIHDPRQARAAAETLAKTAGVTLVGVMGYEAQIAGVTDDSPAIALMKRASTAELAARRDEAVALVREVADLEFVNGGGTGSFETTRVNRSVTELAAGSGLFGPHLFDRYRSFSPNPAVFFALDVVRRPAPGIATVHGGGWIASGATGKDRSPLPVWPQGLRLTAAEGAGEVQTPLRAQHRVPRIGERVWFRHTKAGEVCEHVNELHVIDGATCSGAVSTYRKEGYAFL